MATVSVATGGVSCLTTLSEASLASCSERRRTRSFAVAYEGGGIPGGGAGLEINAGGGGEGAP